MAFTLDQFINAVQTINGQSTGKAIGGFSVAGLTTMQSRAIFIGTEDEGRTPMYQFIERKQVPVTDENGDDCWAVEGAFAGVRDYAIKKGKCAGARKIAIDLDFGTEKVSLITGIGTRAAFSILQSLNILKSIGKMPARLRLVFSRGRSNAKVVFVSLHASDDGLAWSEVYTGDDAMFALPAGSTSKDAEAHNSNLLQRFYGEPEQGEEYEFVAEQF